MEANIINDNFVHDSNCKRIYIKQNMDYEEKYKKTLEKARKELQACGSLDCDAARQIFRFFPELKESKDERIRNFISNELACLRATEEKGFDRYEELTNALAWLEKQGEQKPAAWREEDDNCLSTIIAEFSKCAGKSVSKDEWMRCNDFLNSLRDRVQSPAKQEWSEEDIRFINHIENSLIAYKIIVMDSDVELANYIEKEINWIKSLIPKLQWKPSDEQMEALHTAINVIGKGTLNGKQLIELREELQKLREDKL